MKVKLIVAVIIIALVIWFLHHTAEVRKRMTALDTLESIKVIPTAPAEYKALLIKQEKLSSYNTYISKTRNPILNVCYDKKYIVIVYNLDYNTNLMLSKTINLTAEDEHREVDVIFDYLYDFDQYTVYYKSGFQKKANEIYLNMSGNPIYTLIKNDSVACYYSKVHDFSIGFELNNKQDFYGGCNDEDNSLKFPLEVVFIKRKGTLFVTFMMPKQANTTLTPGSLLSLIKK